MKKIRKPQKNWNMDFENPINFFEIKNGYTVKIYSACNLLGIYCTCIRSFYNIDILNLIHKCDVYGKNGMG